MVKKRAYELKYKDIFIKTGSEYIVVKRTPEKIYYCLLSSSSIGINEDNFIGGKSQEWVEYLGYQIPSKRGYKIVPEILVIDINGDEIGKFKNQKQAEKNLGLYSDYIGRWFRGNLQKSKYKFVKIPV